VVPHFCFELEKVVAKLAEFIECVEIAEEELILGIGEVFRLLNPLSVMLLVLL